MIDREKWWLEAVRFHGHSCPGLAIGVRLALDFLEEAGLTGPAGDEELAAVAETDACGVDGVQVVTGCTAGKGNLWLRARGKHVFTFYRRDNGWNRRYSWIGQLDSEAGRETKTDYFLHGPRAELYRTGPARQPLPPEASLLPSRPCALCGEETAEPNLRLAGGRAVCLDCAGEPMDLSRRIRL